MKLHSHISTAVHERERSISLASAHAPELARSVKKYLGFFRAAGLDDAGIELVAMESFSALDAWRPHLAEEILTIAAHTGIAPWQLAAVNGRTEILAAACRSSHECSTLVHIPAHGSAWGIQTWDWHPDLVTDGLVWTFTTGSGRRITTFTEFGAQAKIGVNDSRLGVMFNFLSHSSDSAHAGVPVHSVARAILEEAATVAEARDLIQSAPLAASSAFTVVQSASAASGERSVAVSFEASPAGIGEVLPDATGCLVRTNHFLDEELAKGDRVPLAESRTLQRLGLLREAAGPAATSDQDPAARAAALYNDGRGAGLCFTPDMALPAGERWETLLTAAISPTEGRLDLSLQAPAPRGEMTFTRY